ncbi:hypothetical protein [Streptomyces coeruleorubidus]|uniref:Uncharacterized protein n=1 Tax=Streptomyces coeruleorubidus TaxID=116188 RepID=A0A5J6HUB6_STRC4|nr:hypothetical protein [Streptomyces coeruleorubidus]QEV23949.1 hypothetical protein CP976_07175 [Streptomyces coeruleorubidus]GGT85914.1 hypothetical protein GCM10010256_52580 [Streptomyces coeruleorubidus]
MATTKKPAGREVVSLDTLAKQKRDALPEPVTFELHGVEFTLEPFNSLPMDVQERMRGPEDYLSILRTALSEEKVKEMIGAGYTLLDLNLVAEEWIRRSGIEPGELGASSAS